MTLSLQASFDNAAAGDALSLDVLHIDHFLPEFTDRALCVSLHRHCLSNWQLEASPFCAKLSSCVRKEQEKYRRKGERSSEIMQAFIVILLPAPCVG